MTPTAPMIPPEIQELRSLTGKADGAQVSDTHWSMMRFGRQAEATAGIGRTGWTAYLARMRAQTAAQWRAFLARVGESRAQRGGR